jgi:hypothetical protein
MTAELITQSDLGVMLSMGGRNAREFCARHGVLPINVGVGKRASLRWSRSAVMQMLCTLQADASSPQKRKAVRSKTKILGKTAALLYKELSAVQ